MSQINPNGQANSGNYNPKRSNINHRGQQQHGSPYTSYAAQGATGYVPAEYMNTYQQVYSPYYPQQQYYPQGFVNVAQMYPPQRQGQDYTGQHQLNITTANGDKVDLRNLNSSYTPKTPNVSLNRSNVSTPKTSAPYTHQRTSSVASATSSSGNDKEADALRESFRQQILAKAKAKQAASAAASSKTTPSSSEAKPVEAKKEASPAVASPAPTPAPVAAESKPKTVSEPVKSQSPAPKKVEDAEDAVRKFKEQIAAKTKKNLEEKTPSPTPEVAKVEETKSVPVPADVETPVQSTEAEKPIVEEPAKVEEAPKVETSTSSEIEPSVIKEETETEIAPETSTEEAKEQPENQEEHKSAALDYTISKFFEQIKKAKNIEDPFSFKYPEGKVGPDAKLQSNDNATKKYRYDPIFLLQFGEPTAFPIDDAFKEEIKFIQINERRNDRSLSKGGPGGFRSGFGQGSIPGIQGSSFTKSGSSRKQFDLNSRSNSRQNSKRRGGSGRNERKSNRNRDRDSERERDDTPAEPLPVLEKSATRWVPKSRLGKTQAEVKYAPDGVTVILSPEEVSRKVKSFLNKLTLEYFEEISNDIINIANQSKWETNGETLESVLELTFAKACDEPHWSSMYAQFCAKMCKDVDSEVTKEGIMDKEGKLAHGGVLVRKLLLARCQIEYTKGWADKLPTNPDGSAIEPEMMSDEYYEAAAAKRRGLGLIRFIGHLYVLGLLSESIIFICLKDQSKNVEDPSEDTVENLIQLVKTVGQRLDTNPNPAARNHFDAFFQSIHLMSQKAKLPSRLEFKLIDLIELRAKKWNGGEGEAGPKTITEIHEEAERKQKENEREQKERRNQTRNDSRSNSSRGAWGNSNRVSSSDIKNVGFVRNSSSSSNLGPTNNFTRTRSQRGNNSNNINTGRQSSQNLASESSTPVAASPLSARENSKKSEPAGNRFALLHEDNQHDDETDESDDADDHTESKEDAATTETSAVEPTEGNEEEDDKKAE